MRMAFIVSPTILLDSAHLLSDAHDILIQRIRKANPPPWLTADAESRHWLMSLSDADLNICEAMGLAAFLQGHHGAAATASQRLKELSARAGRIHNAFPSINFASSVPTLRSRRVKASKHVQIQAVAAEVEKMILPKNGSHSAVQRVLDVGGGHGHLSRHLASELATCEGIGGTIPVVCLDRDYSLLKTARDLQARSAVCGDISFVEADAVADKIDAARPGDLVMGLHACGVLGDEIIAAAVNRRVAGVVLVSCCLQKLGNRGEAVRDPMSHSVRADARALRALSVGRGLLGVTNRVRGFDGPAELLGRETRVALSMLLASRGHETDPSRDVDGLSRHRMRRGLKAVAREALEMRGDHGPVPDREIEMHSSAARLCYRKMRAMSLPRAMLGEVLEMAIVLDRAVFLQESGLFDEVEVCRLFAEEVSMRNLAILAHPRQR